MSATGEPAVPLQASISDGAAQAVEARVSASADNWKRKLLDLTKRNRALNFRMNKVSTIAVVDEQPAEVFRQLYLREEAMRFKAAPERVGASEIVAATAPQVTSVTEVRG